MKFIGRKKELESLELLLKKKSASRVVIRGRRRVGKGRLIKEFVSDKKIWCIRLDLTTPSPTMKLPLATYKNAIRVHQVNPAFTSVTGSVNNAQCYGLSIHLAAVLCIYALCSRHSLDLSPSKKW